VALPNILYSGLVTAQAGRVLDHEKHEMSERRENDRPIGSVEAYPFVFFTPFALSFVVQILPAGAMFVL
jgi:hypothetical protein